MTLTVEPVREFISGKKKKKKQSNKLGMKRWRENALKRLDKKEMKKRVNVEICFQHLHQYVECILHTTCVMYA